MAHKHPVNCNSRGEIGDIKQERKFLDRIDGLVAKKSLPKLLSSQVVKRAVRVSFDASPTNLTVRGGIAWLSTFSGYAVTAARQDTPLQRSTRRVWRFDTGTKRVRGNSSQHRQSTPQGAFGCCT